MTPEEKMRRLREMEDDGTRNQVLHQATFNSFRLICRQTTMFFAYIQSRCYPRHVVAGRLS